LIQVLWISSKLQLPVVHSILSNVMRLSEFKEVMKIGMVIVLKIHASIF